jgi:MFS family permease
MEEIPSWADRFAFLRKLWGHPLFQVRYKRNKLAPILRPGLGFRIGMSVGAAACVVLYLLNMLEPEKFFWSMAITFGLGGLVFILNWLECLANCVVTNAKDYRREASQGMLELIYTTLLTDTWLFYSLFLPCIVKSVNKLEPIVQYFVGLTLVYVVFPAFAGIYAGQDAGGLYFVVGIVVPIAAWTILALILILVLAAVAVGLYSMMSASAYSVSAMAYFHIVITALTGSIFLLLIPSAKSSWSDMIRGLVGTAVFQLSWMVLTIYGTGWSAVMAFSKHRRPGYHEDDKATAFDLMLRGG